MGRKPKIPLAARPAWARRMVEAREAKGLKQDQLAARLGIPQTTLGGYETGKPEPELAVFDRIADALGVKAVWLVYGVDPHNGDAEVASLPGGEKEDRRLVHAVAGVAQMLDEEGIGADLRFLATLARKLALAAKDVEDQTEAREAIRAAIERERKEIRRRLNDLRKSLL